MTIFYLIDHLRFTFTKFFSLMQQGETLLGIHIIHSAWGYPPTKNNLLLQSELYGEQYRRVFWAASYEQVTFSHQEPLSPSGQLPFNTIQKPLFLASGADDVGSSGVMDIYNNVVKVSDACPDVLGLRLLMQETKHSISDERPKHLAEQIVNFLPPKKPTDISFLTTLLLSEPDKRTDISFLVPLLLNDHDKKTDISFLMTLLLSESDIPAYHLMTDISFIPPLLL